MAQDLRIVIPTRPQPDTIVAAFLLMRFGESRFPGIGRAKLEVRADIPELAFEEHVASGIVPLDVGDGPLDHHGTNACASSLVASLLGITRDPALAKLLAYARRDDIEGKGTLSRDPLDRAFGLSGLISSLNKAHPGESQRILDTVLPLLDAHYASAREHHVELPAEIARKRGTGDYRESLARQAGRDLKISFVISDKPSMATYLRSGDGPQADAVVQKAEVGSRVCVMTRQSRNVDLRMAAALMRLREAELRRIEVPTDPERLSAFGRIDELPMWYLDPATNSILNVGGGDADTRIPWEEMGMIVVRGLELAPGRA